MSAVLEKSINFPLTSHQEKAVRSDAPIVFIVGPEGVGKTYCMLIAMIYHAANRMQGKPLQAAIIRDTFENIQTKTIPSIQKAIATIAEKNGFLGYIQAWQWSRGGKRLVCKAPNIQVDLFGADDLASVARVQGGEWSFIVIEEPAPMYTGNSAGVPRAVFDACVSRSARGGSTMKLIVDQNPGDEDHWTFDAAIRNPIMRPEWAPLIYTEVVNIPPGTNPARTELMEQATKAAYRHDAALSARYVDGKWAFVQQGEKVTPEYHDTVDGHSHHYTGKTIEIIPGAMGFRSWDGGHWPTCIMGQVSPSGRLNIIHAFRGEHIGMKQLIDTQVKPIVGMYYGSVTEWMDTGDPSLVVGDDSDIEQSPANVIEKSFNTVYQGASHWPAVLEPMKAALNLSIDGKPYIQIGIGAEILHKALRGGWHYLTTNSGQVIRDKPVKDHHSHPGDCFGALCLKLFGNTEKVDDVPVTDIMYKFSSMGGGWNGG